MKNKNSISDSGEPCGIPVYVLIQSLSYPGYMIHVRLPCVKLTTIWTIQSGSPFFFRIVSSLLCGTLLNTPARLRLSINTILPGFAFHAVWTHKVSRLIAERVERSFRAPI
jgi:hypothetical protein